MCVEKMMSEPSATAPGFAQLLSNAQALETFIAEQVDVAEAERHMPARHGQLRLFNCRRDFRC